MDQEPAGLRIRASVEQLASHRAPIPDEKFLRESDRCESDPLRGCLPIPGFLAVRVIGMPPMELHSVAEAAIRLSASTPLCRRCEDHAGVAYADGGR